MTRMTNDSANNRLRHHGGAAALQRCGEGETPIPGETQEIVQSGFGKGAFVVAKGVKIGE